MFDRFPFLTTMIALCAIFVLSSCFQSDPSNPLQDQMTLRDNAVGVAQYTAGVVRDFQQYNGFWPDSLEQVFADSAFVNARKVRHFFDPFYSMTLKNVQYYCIFGPYHTRVVQISSNLDADPALDQLNIRVDVDEKGVSKVDTVFNDLTLFTPPTGQ